MIPRVCSQEERDECRGEYQSNFPPSPGKGGGPTNAYGTKWFMTGMKVPREKR